MSVVVDELDKLNRKQIIDFIMIMFGRNYDPNKEFPSKITSVVYKKDERGKLVSCCLIDGERIYVAAAKSAELWIELFEELIANNYNVWCTVKASKSRIQALCIMAGLRLEQDENVIRKIISGKTGVSKEDVIIEHIEDMVTFRQKKREWRLSTSVIQILRS